MTLERGSLGYRIDIEDRVALYSRGHEPAALLKAAKEQLPAHNHIGNAFSVLNVLDQGNQGACQGHALALIFSICYYLTYGRVLDFSRAAGYYLSQKEDGINSDQGSTLSAGRKVAANGMCLEGDWPYPPSYNNRRPPSATPDKFVFKLKSTKAFEKTEEGFQLMLDWLRQGLPVQTGMFWNGTCDQEVVRNYSWSNRDGGHSTVFWLFKDDSELQNNNSWGRWNSDGIHSWTMPAIRQCFFCDRNEFIGYAPDGLECPNPTPV